MPRWRPAARSTSGIDGPGDGEATYYVDVEIRSARTLEPGGLAAVASAACVRTYETTRKVYESLAQGEDARWVVVGDRFLLGSDVWVSGHGC